MEETKDSLLLKKDDPKALFEALNDFMWSEHEADVKKLPSLLLELHRATKIDFCLKGAQAIDHGVSPFDVAHVLEGVLYEMDLDVKSVLTLIQKFNQGMRGDLAAFTQFQPFQNLVERQPDFARKLLNSLIDESEPYVTGYISNLYRDFAKGREKEIHAELSCMSSHESESVLMAVADVLGALDYNPKINRHLVRPTIKILERLESCGSDNVARTVVYAYRNLIPYSKSLTDKLVQLSKSESVEIQYAISDILFRLKSDEKNVSWFLETLMNLTKVSPNHKGIIDNLDLVLHRLIKKDGCFCLVEEFLTLWILKSGYIPKEAKFYDLFNSTLPDIIQDRSNFEGLLTRFLNHDNWQFHEIAAQILSYCQVRKIKNVKLSGAELKRLSHEDCLYICRKILGYVVSPDQLCSLGFSVLDKSPQDQEIKSLIYAVFRNHIGENYPGKTIEFLQAASVQTKSKHRKLLAETIVRDIEAVENERSGMPLLKEMTPAHIKLKRILHESQVKMSQAMEHAQEGSITSMISTKILLKHGTGSFHLLGDQYSEVFKLGSYSTFMELPRSEATNPVQAAMERVGFRMAKRVSE